MPAFEAALIFASADAACTALSSGFPAAFARTSPSAQTAAEVLRMLEASRRQREQQDALLQKAERELLKAAKRAQVAIERRVGAPEPVSARALSPSSVRIVTTAESRSSKSSNAAMVQSPPRTPLSGTFYCSRSRSVNPTSKGNAVRSKSPPNKFTFSSPHTPKSHITSPITSPRVINGQSSNSVHHSPRAVSGLAFRKSPVASKVEDLDADEVSSSASFPSVHEETSVRRFSWDFSHSTHPSLPPAKPWRHQERTVGAYISRRIVGMPEYEEVCHRYEGHLNDFKQLCDTIRSHSDKQLGPSSSPRQSNTASPQQTRRDLMLTKGPVDRACNISIEEDDLDPSELASLQGSGFLSQIPRQVADADGSVEDDLGHVAALFLSQVPDTVVLSVHRIENQMLADIYSTLRKTMLSKCELDLWHGTSFESVANIVRNGFNRAYSGKRHGTKLGHGTYFSASASHCTRYCDRKTSRRTVIFAKVLVGAWTKGSPDLLEPPHRVGDRLARYDSTVDDVSAPLNFCIFRDFQALPTHVLQFSASKIEREK